MRKLRLIFLAIALLFGVAVMACSRDSVPASTPTPSPTPKVDTQGTGEAQDDIADYLATLPITTIVLEGQTITVRYELIKGGGQDSPPFTIYGVDLDDEHKGALAIGDLFDDKSAELVWMNLDFDSKLPSLILGSIVFGSLKQEGVGSIEFKNPEWASPRPSYQWRRSDNAAKTPSEESIRTILEGVDPAALFGKVNHILSQLALAE